MKTSILSLLIFVNLLMGCAKESSNPNETATTQIGDGFDGEITALQTDNSGNVYMSGGDPFRIRKLEGNAWILVGDSSVNLFTGGIRAPFTIDNNGNIYAVGSINKYKENSEQHIIKWEKATNKWINLTAGNPLFNNSINAIACDGLGSVYVSGESITNTEYVFVYHYNGSVWTKIKTAIPGDPVYVTCDQQNNVYINSWNNTANSVSIEKWDGSNWNEIGGPNFDFGVGSISTMKADSKGNLYVGGGFVQKSGSLFNIFRWSKSENKWYGFYTFYNSSEVRSIAFDSDDILYVGGRFYNEANKYYVAKQKMESWENYGKMEYNNVINALCFDKAGTLYVGGSFVNAKGKYFVSSIKKN